MTIDENIKDEKYNTILTEEQQKCQHYHQVKLINMNILQEKKYYHLIKIFSTRKAFEKQINTIEDQGIKQVE